MTHITCSLTANKDQLRNPIRAVIEYGLPLLFLCRSVRVWSVGSAAYAVGTPAAAAPTVCGQTVSGERRARGVLMSPTYPGVYPDNLFCFYRLHGARGQRVRLTFDDLDLYSGGDQ